MKKLITSLLGLSTLGVGVTGIILPQLLGKVLGLKGIESNSYLMRAIGVRDAVLGLGILTHRSQPKEAAFWVSSLGAVVAVDAVGRLISLRQPDASPLAKIEAIQAAGVSAGCFIWGFVLSRQAAKAEPVLAEATTETSEKRS